MTKINTPTFQYLSFKHSSVEERITAMHVNKLINIKARYKTLYNVNVDQTVKYEENKKKLGQILKGANHNGCLLFLVIENGSSIKVADVYMVIKIKYTLIIVPKEHIN